MGNKSQLGWDWFSLVSEQTPKQGLMLFCVRDAQQNYDYCSGTRIAPDGKATQIPREEIQLKALKHISIENSKYPSQWQITLPNTAPILIESITQNSLNKLSIKYWEGRVTASGGFTGLGYAELAGY